MKKILLNTYVVFNKDNLQGVGKVQKNIIKDNKVFYGLKLIDFKNTDLLKEYMIDDLYFFQKKDIINLSM